MGKPKCPAMLEIQPEESDDASTADAGAVSVGLLIETNLIDHNAMVEVLHDLIERVPLPPEHHHQLEIRL
jgi:hypothetical protein